MTNIIYTVAHEAAFIAYVCFGVLVALRSARTWLVGFLFASVVTTAFWAQACAAIANGFAPDWLIGLTSTLRHAAWISLCLALIYPRAGQTPGWRGLFILAVVLLLLQLGLDLNEFQVGVIAGVRIDVTTVDIAIAVLGLVLVENILRNSSSSEFWSLKHLLIGLSCLWFFQLISRVPEFLTRSRDPNIELARPLVYLLVLPLLIVSSIRIPNLKLRIHSSRAFIFHSATLIAAGIMLQGVAVAAWYVREYGGSTGTVLAVILLFGGAVAVTSALVSGELRSRFRRFINENFFSLKYDYRVEWEKVIRELSLNPEQGSAERVLRTLCDLLDSAGGAIWIYRASWHQFLPAAKLGFTSSFVPIPESDPRVEFFRSQETAYLVLGEAAEGPAAVAWNKQFATEWIAIPLRYRSTVVGLAVLTKTRAPKKMDWEDENLIRLVALQLGAYLVQEETAQSLADARQLEEFNKRFAFVVHDIKNTIGQLSLLVRNAGEFGHQKEFRDDMVVTLGNAVERLEQLLTSLTTVGTENVPGNRISQTIDLIAFISEFTKQRDSLGQRVVLDTSFQTLELQLTDVANLRRVLDHVVTNATDASGADNPVEISIATAKSKVEINVTDHGAGMTEQFINEELFRPMRTTKSGGFGIGAYQARELMRDLGGDIMVTSTIGQGTSVTLSLPRREPQEIHAE